MRPVSLLFRGVTFAAGLALLVAMVHGAGYRFNTSSSSAGLVWRVTAPAGEYGIGDFVVFCPDRPFVQQYLVPVWNRAPAARILGDCPITPFLKRIVGVPTDQVSIDRDGIRVNGQTVANSRPQPGLAVYSRAFGVAAGEYVVAGEAADSLDSRYFGPVPARSITGRAHRVF